MGKDLYHVGNPPEEGPIDHCKKSSKEICKESDSKWVEWPSVKGKLSVGECKPKALGSD